MVQPDGVDHAPLDPQLMEVAVPEYPVAHVIE